MIEVNNITISLKLRYLKDKKAPVSMAYKIYNSCKSERELYIVSEAEHTGCYRTDPEKYKMIVSEFIEKHIPR